ncbi:MAG: YggS family pyridoxal phosphate-dependent enzyme [Candidatus Sedimenticola sp. (ex Thyasira tokunagai)]
MSLLDIVDQNIIRFKTVLHKINIACESSNRNPDKIKIVLVTKTIPLEIINSTITRILEEKLLNPNKIILGENKVQEASKKFISWNENSKYNNFERHFIGHLQSNKINKIIHLTHLLHSLDSLLLAEKLNRNAKKKNILIDSLIQINIAKETSKFGLNEDSLIDFLKKMNNFNQINIKGFMTMAPNSTPEKVEPIFNQLKLLKAQINHLELMPPLEELSMGMSNDFETAIKCGATIIRIGSAIFGTR